MTEEEWLECNDPTPMLEFLREKVSTRKLICFFLAFCRDFTSYTTDEGCISDGDFRPPWLDVNGPDDDALPSPVRCWGWAKLVTHPLSASKDKTQARAVASPLLRELLGNPFRPIIINPTWLTPTVINLAHVGYEERFLPSGELDTACLAILADALEEASCNNQEILTHLRSPGPHYRGCHVLDLLLGRE